MKYLVAAAAALSLIGGSAAMAQPAYDNHSRGQTYYGQSGHGGQDGHGQPYSDVGHRGSARGYSQGYAQPYAGYGYRDGSSYYGAQAYSYDDRHHRRDHRRAQGRHYDAPRYNGHDRH
ncbi:hypothetical protein [Phenylobacterium sp. SCN 70-31]|mgnify:CR=1 FL=1|uniref:hypothetical protein n=1 Tax=Phenylobacterium sp. SCN 70-31 TaxID=1660129 RepID=UPI00086D20E7|nr:hypothetical protein [Phenylobacterium sp. SCN 70-31]ODT84949.1 MAG: hypothetical protein ABS78_21905 [Phenylobacterium sp. SCN 70-31]